MEKDNCELLFEYLKSILYDPQIMHINVGELDAPYQKLGKGLEFLAQEVEELRTYSADLSQGNLSGQFPSKDNFLCTNLKNLHANLNHLTWQAKQVAAGDYSQHVSYLGEFSEAFNTMTEQLMERETLLKQEAESLRRRAEVIEQYNQLLMNLTRRRKEWILVVDGDSREIVYCNKSESENQAAPHSCDLCIHKLFFRERIVNWQDGEQYKEWEQGNETDGYYRITSFCVEWLGKNSYAHIISDITDEKLAATRLTSKAYYDPGTGIYNRLFFEEYMEHILKEREDRTLCYLDMDGLKAVNDRYGHNEGDDYIRYFIDAVRKSFRSTDVFARIGGDEFCLILPDLCKRDAERKMNEVLARFVSENKKEYPVSFSFGVVEINGQDQVSSMEEVIRKADILMYQFKRKNKEKYHGQTDGRLL